jgi:hypothetical protein
MPARFPLCARAGPFTETGAGRSGRLTATQPKNGGRNRSTAPRSSPRVRAGRAANTTFFACGWWNALVCSSRVVRYEDVVADIETQARRIIACCGLRWHDNCLSFHKTDRPVCTASATQVRQPIYSSAVGRSRVDEQSLPRGRNRGRCDRRRRRVSGSGRRRRASTSISFGIGAAMTKTMSASRIRLTRAANEFLSTKRSVQSAGIAVSTVALMCG